MKCLIIAAGRGSRLSVKGDIKPLIRIQGIPIIERVIRNAVIGGITEFVIVTGYRTEMLRSFLESLSVRMKIPIHVLINREGEKGNGLSVLSGKPLLTEKFILLMSDHLFDPTTLRDLRNEDIRQDEVILAVDSNIKENVLVDLDDVTRVQTAEGKILKIGKHLPDYNAFDTGMFLCTPSLFEAIEKSLESTGNQSLSGGMEILSTNGKARTFDINNRFWIDIDDDAMFDLAEGVLIREEG